MLLGQKGLRSAVKEESLYNIFKKLYQPSPPTAWGKPAKPVTSLKYLKNYRGRLAIDKTERHIWKFSILIRYTIDIEKDITKLRLQTYSIYVNITDDYLLLPY